jgi:hypothetical protein
MGARSRCCLANAAASAHTRTVRPSDMDRLTQRKEEPAPATSRGSFVPPQRALSPIHLTVIDIQIDANDSFIEENNMSYRNIALSVPSIRGNLSYSMKTPHPYNTSRPRGEWRPTPPHGQVQGRHVARKGSTSQSSPLGPDLHRRTPNPYLYKSRVPKKARQVPWEGPSPPPSKVRALARSRDGKDPSMRGGPVLARV